MFYETVNVYLPTQLLKTMYEEEEEVALKAAHVQFMRGTRQA